MVTILFSVMPGAILLYVFEMRYISLGAVKSIAETPTATHEKISNAHKNEAITFLKVRFFILPHSFLNPEFIICHSGIEYKIN